MKEKLVNELIRLAEDAEVETSKEISYLCLIVRNRWATEHIPADIADEAINEFKADSAMVF